MAFILLQDLVFCLKVSYSLKKEFFKMTCV